MKKKLYVWLPALLLVCSLMAMKTLRTQGYQVGDKIKDFSLKNIDGQMVSLKTNAAAKGFIVTFTCNHCPFAVKYQDRVVALHKKYAPLGYPVLPINPNDPAKEPEDSFDNMKVRAKEKNFTFPYLFDETQEVAKTFGAARTPHIYIVRKVGADFVVEYIGAIDDNANDASKVQKKYVEDAINELLAGKPVTTNQTKAIGCTIKWKDA